MQVGDWIVFAHPNYPLTETYGQGPFEVLETGLYANGRTPWVKISGNGHEGVLMESLFRLSA